MKWKYIFETKKVVFIILNIFQTESTCKMVLVLIIAFSSFLRLHADYLIQFHNIDVRKENRKLNRL